MTRTEKLERIKKYRPRLYAVILKSVPRLVANPYVASEKDIELYNGLIAKVAKMDRNNNTFKNNFSF